MIKLFLNLYFDICTLSFAERYCAPQVSQYHCSDLVHISQYKLGTIYHHMSVLRSVLLVRRERVILVKVYFRTFQ